MGLKKKVISRTSIRPAWPVGMTVILWLLLDRLQPPGWVVGVAWTICVLIWIVIGVNIFTTDDVKLDLENLVVRVSEDD